jgi:hypothetical protein
VNIKHYILSVLLLLCTSTLFAQDAKFTVSVSKMRVGTGEDLEVTFSLTGNAEKFIPPGFNGFQVVSGPNESTSMTSINGNTTSSTAVSYVLIAVKEGQYSIGPASVVSNGHVLATRPVTITVVKGRPQPQQRPPGGGGAPGQRTPPGVVEDNSVDLSKMLFVRAVTNKSDVYQGEQINLNYRIYARVEMQSQVDKLPDLNGFWSQDLIDPKLQQKPQWRTEIYKGQRYSVADLKQTILFPEHSGNLTIDPMGLTVIARIPAPARDVMEQFFGGGFRDIKAKIKSAPVIIHVKPLPDAGKPLGFGGAVGTFSLNTTVDKIALKANEALNYNVKITGSGNIKLFTPLTVNFPIDFEKYDPKTTDTINKSLTGVSGTRMYNYLLIPRHGGKYTIEPLKFSYFNPANGKYVTLTSKPFNITVAKGANEANVTALAGADKQDVKLLDKDIRYIKSDLVLNDKGDEFFGSLGFYLLILLGPVLFIAALIYRNLNEKANSDIVKVKSRKASKIAAKHLANAKKQLSAKNTKAFYEDTFKGLYGYLSFKLNIPYANLDQETIATTLRNRSVSEPVVKQLLDTLDLCDMARFAPVTGISEQEVFEKAKNTIDDIEDEL